MTGPKTLTDQSADGDLALLLVTRDRRIEVRGPEGDQPKLPLTGFLLAVRSTFKKSGLHPFNAKGVGQGDNCGLPVT